MVTIVRTPLRVSLFGGGTDYPEYFERRPGAVLGLAINKYIYTSALPLGACVDYRYRLAYSRLEETDSVAGIQHPVVRAVLHYMNWDTPTDFSMQADMPASIGLGSSSAFTVGFVNLMSELSGQPRTRMELAREAIFVERKLLNENVGVQDQLHAAFGGMNRFDLSGDTYRISPVNISAVEMNRLSDWLMLVYTGIKRRATEIVAEQVSNTSKKMVDSELASLLDLVNEAQLILESGRSTEVVAREIGALLDTSWQIKKKLSSSVSRSEIDELYEFCIGRGAIGGKLCGAGGGGFLLLVIPPDRRKALQSEIGERRCIGLQIDQHGSQIISRGSRDNLPTTSF